MKKSIDYFEEFYRQYGSPMIHENFPEYEGRIAVGLVGEGSDCFGYDDEISRDHDFGLGFCMWLHAADYAKIGEKLENLYRNLLAGKGEEFARRIWGGEAAGYKPRFDSRRGVFEITRFYKNILRVPIDDEEELLIGENMYHAEERFLATAVNGRVFRDDDRAFSLARERLLKFYPEKQRRLKIAQSLHLFSHGGQSNYPRMMARKDYVAARLALDLTIENALHLAYLLNKVYMPYYKWQRKGLNDLPKLREIGPLLDALCVLNVQDKAWENKTYNAVSLNMDDPVVALVEKIAEILLAELNAQGIVKGSETFLEIYAQAVASGSET